MKPTKNYAVTAIRKSDTEGADDFPTPPWAVRALCQNVLFMSPEQKMWDCWEPACGRGYMAETLKEYFTTVYSTDKYDYGYGGIQDFTKSASSQKVAWVITNPPFKQAEEFIDEARRHARRGVAMLVRTSFLEGVGRYNRLFKNNPPSILAQFSERVPMVKGRLDKNASTATSYCWLIWNQLSNTGYCHIEWIAPCRKIYERESDYIIPVKK